MSIGTRITSVLTGMLLTNAVPYMLVAVAGRRHMTPFGRDSLP